MDYTQNPLQEQGKSMSLVSITARKYLENGLSILPEKAKKPPFSGWAKYRIEPATLQEIEAWFQEYNEIAILPGKVSGNLEIIDVDLKNDPKKSIVDDYQEAISEIDQELFWKLTLEESPSGGIHLAYRCSEIGKTEVLAYPDEGDKPIIELLSENGKCTCYPTPKYSLLQRSYLNIPIITPEERATLLTVARSFNKRTEKYHPQKVADRREYSALTPWEDYDRRGGALDLLLKHGWQRIGGNGDTIYLRRPEKQEKENSASWNSEKRTLFVWTHQTIFQAGKAYSPSAIYAFLECGGDFREMARRLSEEGFGERIERPASGSATIAQSKESEIELESTTKKTKNILLNVDKIHPLFKEYAKYAEGTEIYREFMISALLVSFGVLLGNKVYRCSGASKIRPNFYMCFLGDSGWGRKSSSMEYGIEGLREINKKVTEEYFQRREAFFQEMQGKKVNRENADQEPKDPRYIYPNEFSVASFVKKLEGMPHGLFVTGEIGGVLAKMNSPNAVGFKEMMTDIYEHFGTFSKELNSYSVLVEAPSPSWVGASTLPWLQKHLGDEDMFTGFLGRFIFVIRSEFPEKPCPSPPKLVLSQIWKDVFRWLQEFSGELQHSPEAQKCWEEWYKENFYEAEKAEDSKRSSLNRLLRICEKVAIINHCLDAILDEAPNKFVIEKKSYERAFPWIEFFAKNLEICANQLTTRIDYQEMKVLEVIRSKGKKEQGFVFASKSVVAKCAHLNKKQMEEIEGTLEMKNQICILKNGKYTFYKMKI